MKKTTAIENTSIERLEKRRRLMHALIGVFIVVALIWIVLLILDLIEDKKIDFFNISGLMSPLALIWIPIFDLKKVNKELERRKRSGDPAGER
jgi:hypothetical protein